MIEILKYSYKYISIYKWKYIMFIFFSIVNSLLVVLLPLIEGELINIFTSDKTFINLCQLLLLFSFISLIIIIISILVNRLYLNLQVQSLN